MLEKIKNFKQEDILFIGIGNEALGDDGAGPYFISLLEEYQEKHGFKFLNCGTVLESFFSKIKELKPKLIIFVDAAKMDGGEPAGHLKNIHIDDISNASCSTHSLPLGVFVKFLQTEMNPSPEFMVYAVKADNLEFGAVLNEKIKESLKKLTHNIIKESSAGLSAK